MLIIHILIQTAMNPIEEHRWKQRVLIFSASAPTNVGYKRQEQLMEKGKRGMKERDLVIYKLYDDHWLGPGEKMLSEEQAAAIREAYDIPESQFMVVLIGKDGGIKMRKDDIVSSREIFELIDSMPMRKTEMRRQKSAEDGG